MARNNFVMDTKGYCIFCLTSASSQEGEELHHDPGISKVASLQRFCHYLKLNMKKIFHDVIAVSPASLSVLEKSELNGVLCEECFQQIETISEITLELEVLQMTLDSSLRNLHDKVKGIQGNEELMVKFKQEMLNSPQSLLHYGIVDQLRKETLRKSSLLLEKAQPRVTLARIDIREPDVMPQLSESIPIISSIQGNYTDGTNNPFAPKPKISSSMDNFEMESNVGNISPRPGSPLVTQMEIEVVNEDPLASPASTSSMTVTGPGLSFLQPTHRPPPPIFTGNSWQCKFCLKTFKKIQQRNIHEKNHQIKETRSTKAKRLCTNFQCKFCPATFMFQSNMNLHMEKFHNPERRNQSQSNEFPAQSQESSTERLHFEIGNIERIELNDVPDRDPLSDFYPEDEPEQGPSTTVTE